MFVDLNRGDIIIAVYINSNMCGTGHQLCADGLSFGNNKD